MVLQIEKPIIPGVVSGEEILPYSFLASLSLTSEEMSKLCVREAEVIDIESIASRTVTVSCLGSLYENIPVCIHTDYGTRGRKYADVEATNASEYFEKATFLFPFKSGYLHRGIRPKIAVSTSWQGETRDIKVLCLVKETEESTEVLCVINVIDNGVGSTGPLVDIRNFAFPTYRPYFLLKERIGSSPSFTYSVSLYDFLTGDVAQIPNVGYTALVAAESIDPDTYSEFLTGGIEEYPLTNYTDQTCVVSASFSYGDSDSVGTQYYTGSCSCDSPVGSGPTWECTGITLDGDGHFTFYSAVDLCTGDSTVEEHRGGDPLLTTYVEVDIPSGAHVQSLLSTEVLRGRHVISWTNRTRTDTQDTAYNRLYTTASGVNTFTHTITINTEEMVITKANDANVPDGYRIIMDSTGSYLFSFSIVQLILYDSTYTSFGSLVDDFTPLTGIDTSGIPDFIVDRYEALRTANPGSDILLDTAVVHIPYNIKEFGLT